MNQSYYSWHTSDRPTTNIQTTYVTRYMIWCRVSEMIRLAITGLARDAVGLPGQTVTSGDMVKVTSITSHGLSRVTCHESRVSRARPWRATSGRRTSPGCGGGWWPRWACWWRPSCSTPRSPSSSPPRWTVTTSQRVTCHVSRARPQHGPARPRHPRLHRHHPRHRHAARLRGRQGGGARPQ